MRKEGHLLYSGNSSSPDSEATTGPTVTVMTLSEAYCNTGEKSKVYLMAITHFIKMKGITLEQYRELKGTKMCLTQGKEALSQSGV